MTPSRGAFVRRERRRFVRRERRHRPATGADVGGVPHTGGTGASLRRRLTLEREDTPVWSARRRPRWGVRWRLDVANLFATDVRLDLTERAIYGQALFGGGTSGDMRSVSLPHIHVTKESMISRDARRERGIYLGEMVWALIFAALNKVAYLYPGRVVSNGTLAAVLGLKSAGAATGRRALEGIINTVGSTGLGAAPPTSSRRSRGFCPRVERCLVACRCPGHLDRREGECVLSVTLLAGRRMTRESTDGQMHRINAQAVFQLARHDVSLAQALDSAAGSAAGTVVDQQASGLRIWTKRPSWNETFDLGPILRLEATTLRVACVDRCLARIARKTPRKWLTFSRRPATAAARPGDVDVEEAAAEVEVKLANIFLLGDAAPSRGAQNGIVGWFPLVSRPATSAHPRFSGKLTGELKLRFHLRRAHLLEGLDETCRQELIRRPSHYVEALNRGSDYTPGAW